MKVQEFIEMYKKNPRIDIAKTLETVQYVSIALKREMAQLILQNCTTMVDGEIRIDSVDRYILFTIATIGMHTNLEFAHEEDDDNSVIGDYDALCEAGLLIKIIDTFKDDYMSCQEILNMMTSDKLQESMTIEKKIYKFIDVIEGLLDGAVDHLVDKLDVDALGDLPLDNLLELRNLIDKK